MTDKIHDHVNYLLNTPISNYNKLYRNGNNLTRLIIDELLQNNHYGGTVSNNYITSEELRSNYKNISKNFKYASDIRKISNYKSRHDKHLNKLDEQRGITSVSLSGEEIKSSLLNMYNFQTIVNYNYYSIINSILYFHYKSLAYIVINTLQILLLKVIPNSFNLSIDINFNNEIINEHGEYDDNVLLYAENFFYNFINSILLFVKLCVPMIGYKSDILSIYKNNKEETKEIKEIFDSLSILYQQTPYSIEDISVFNKVYSWCIKKNNIHYFDHYNAKLQFPYVICTNNVFIDYNKQLIPFCTITINKGSNKGITSNYYPDVSGNPYLYNNDTNNMFKTFYDYVNEHEDINKLSYLKI